MRLLSVVLLAAALAAAQKAPRPKPATEEEHLRQALSEAGSSPLEIIRVIERHLAQYPNSERRGELERALVRAAVDARDNDRLLRYGPRYLEHNPSDLVVLERVTRLLVARPDKASNERGEQLARLFEQGVRELEKNPEGGRMTASLREDLDRALARALTFQARACGQLGRVDQAVALARQALALYASAEPAREVARWLLDQGRVSEALSYLADAFILPDPRLSEEDRQQIRLELGRLWSKLHGSEKGLGDLILAAYDRSRAAQEERRARLRAVDPNAGLSDPMEFTLAGINGDRIELRTLRGKVVVLDFWATWCGPCRVQYPLYEQVRQRFQSRGDVVFLGISTDENREAVKPFLEQNRWKKAVYFEDGLSRLLNVSSIPTTIIFDKQGTLAARLNGFVPDRFVDMLTERIEEALKRQ